MPPSSIPLQPLSLLHPDPCYAPLGLARLPKGNPPPELPTQAVLLGAPTGGPSLQGQSTLRNTRTQGRTRPPYLQLDLLLPRNLTGQCGGGGAGGTAVIVGGLGLTQLCPLPCPPGIIVQGAGSSALLEFSTDGLRWHNYSDILPGTLPPAKVLPPEPPGPVTNTPLWVPRSLSPGAFQCP